MHFTQDYCWIWVSCCWDWSTWCCNLVGGDKRCGNGESGSNIDTSPSITPRTKLVPQAKKLNERQHKRSLRLKTNFIHITWLSPSLHVRACWKRARYNFVSFHLQENTPVWWLAHHRWVALPCYPPHHRVISLWIFVPANKTDCTLATHGADQGSSATVIKAASNFSFERKENVQFAGQPHSSCKVPTEDVLKFIIREKKKRWALCRKYIYFLASANL